MGVPQIGSDSCSYKTNSLSAIVCQHAFEFHMYHLGKLNFIPFMSEETVINS